MACICLSSRRLYSSNTPFCFIERNESKETPPMTRLSPLFFKVRYCVKSTVFVESAWAAAVPSVTPSW